VDYFFLSDTKGKKKTVGWGKNHLKKSPKSSKKKKDRMKRIMQTPFTKGVWGKLQEKARGKNAEKKQGLAASFKRT